MPVRSREIHALSSRIQLPVLRKLLSIMDGHHSALRHGRGWEFMDLAPYQPGDDVREIDWAATARTGSPIIKRHEATANLQVMLVVDTGREMGALAPSGETKEEVALAACEAIAWLSTARGDQIGLVAGDDKRVRFMPARSGNAHARRCCAASKRTSPCAPRMRTSRSSWLGPGRSRVGAASSSSSRTVRSPPRPRSQATSSSPCPRATR